VSDNGRISLLFLLNLALYFIAGELNFILGNWSIYLHLDALLIVFFGLHLSRMSGLLYTTLLGFLADALHPAGPGTYLAGYLCIWMFFVWCQRRIRRQNRNHVRLITVAAQSAWLVALALLLGREQLGSVAYWSRVIHELLLSAAIVFVAAWPWCKLQRSFLHSLGWDLESEMTHL
jgi:cell shape-determining protein MreD